ncbi:hypothetical protein BKA80DRAFT_281763 [Phyllosticta citrichinensis]
MHTQVFDPLDALRFETPLGSRIVAVFSADGFVARRVTTLGRRLCAGCLNTNGISTVAAKFATLGHQGKCECEGWGCGCEVRGARCMSGRTRQIAPVGLIARSLFPALLLSASSSLVRFFTWFPLCISFMLAGSLTTAASLSIKRLFPSVRSFLGFRACKRSIKTL